MYFIKYKNQSCCKNLTQYKKLSYRWQTVRRIQRSVKVTKHGTIPHVRYGVLLVCYSSFVPNTSRFFQILDFEICPDLDIRVKESVKVIENVTIRYSAYDFLLMIYSNYDSISCRFWDIQCQKILQPWNPGQGSIKVTESSTIWQIGYGFLLVFYSNFVPKTGCFWDIWLQICHDLENRVSGPSRSL